VAAAGSLLLLLLLLLLLPTWLLVGHLEESLQHDRHAAQRRNMNHPCTGFLKRYVHTETSPAQ
jgi:hypothetical protein